ncbi:MAG: GNAT family N-acetyltransferase [Proteobacteria bacterium]|nr:GNAT family N-acetyltransferase [Pseudomonadota bacterium]
MAVTTALGGAEEIGAAEVLDGDRVLAAGRVRLLAWDTDFFGFPCARIEALTATGENPARYDAVRRAVADLLGWCDDRGVKFVTVKVAGPEPILVQALESRGFYVTDCTVALARDDHAPLPQSSDSLDEFSFHDRIEDHAGTALAFSGLILDGRFHNDVRISKKTADGLWQRAVLNQTRSEAREVLLMTRGADPVGLTTIKPVDPENRAGCLFFVGLRGSYQARGLGRVLLGETLYRVRGEYDRLEVETSTYNQPALRLYQGQGFKPSQVKLSLHCWR